MERRISVHLPNDPAERKTSLAGLAMAALGVVAFIAAATRTAGVPILLGALFFISGILELVDESLARASKRSERIGFSGAMPIFLSVFLVFQLGLRTPAIALAIGLYFLANGALHGIVALIDRYPRRRIDLAFGAVSVVLGIITVAARFSLGPALLTVLVGVELMVRAVAMVLRDFAIERAAVGTRAAV